MKFVNKIEHVLIIIVSVLCSILLFNLLRRLRNILPWKVNCWFCNSNHWVKLPERNSWICVNCDQYNGFTKDGDYNKVLFNSDQTTKPYKSTSKISPPKNGLCKMCNINQQLKIAQLANYIPINEKNFDDEIDKYKAQLEKAYKLCSPCRKLVQIKLHREKEILLGSKLLEMRTPEKSKQSKPKQSKIMEKALNFLTGSLISAIIILVSTETFYVLKENNLSSSLSHSIELLYTIAQRIINIFEMKTDIIIEFNKMEDIKQFLYFDKIGSIFSKYSNGIAFSDNLITQQILGGTICLVQILRHLLGMTRIKFILVLDFLLTMFLATSIAQQSKEFPIMITSIIKQCCILAAWFVFRHKEKPIGSITRIQSPPKRIKNLINSPSSLLMSEDSSSNLDTDDDVSLRKFGIHNLTDSSNDTLSPKNRSYLNGRRISPHSRDSIWSSPKSNSMYCVNSYLKGPSLVSDNPFTKPTFNEYQESQRDDSDSDLDDGISSLSISSPKKRRHKANSVFSLRQFTATPSFVRPTIAPMHITRPLISPSKLGHNASWVAGGYWGCEGERSKFPLDDSRSSSQSSGFESQTSSVHQRNVFSQPPSREESVCRDSERGSVFDRFATNSVMSSTYQTAHNLSRISSPIYPQMQYDNHVHIPRVQGSTDSLFNYPPSINAQSDIFKAPVGSSLIKLPQMNLYSN